MSDTVLVDLLSHCRTSGLHTGGGADNGTAAGGGAQASSTSSSFTLAQLVVLHDTLLSTALQQRDDDESQNHYRSQIRAWIDAVDHDAEDSTSFLHEFLLRMCQRDIGAVDDNPNVNNDESKQEYVRMFFWKSDRDNLQVGGDEQRLLVIQFLLRRFFGFFGVTSRQSPSSNDHPQPSLVMMTTGLTRFLIPYILMTKTDGWDDSQGENMGEEADDYEAVLASSSGYASSDTAEKIEIGDFAVPSGAIKPPSYSLSVALLELMPSMVKQILVTMDSLQSSSSATSTSLLAPMIRLLANHESAPMVGKVLVSLMRIVDEYNDKYSLPPCMGQDDRSQHSVSHDFSRIVIETFHGRVSSLIDQAISSGSSSFHEPDERQRQGGITASNTPASTTSHNTMAELLSCVSQSYILPLLSPSSVPPSSSLKSLETNLAYLDSDLHRDFLNDHWLHIMRGFHIWSSNNIKNQAPSKARASSQHLVVWTTILCPLWPIFVKRDLPIVGRIPGAQEQKGYCRPICEPLVWKLIYACLCAGSGLEDDQSDEYSQQRQQRNNHIDVFSLVRRRGLYLLDVMVDEEALVRSLPSFPCAIWKDYALCLDTFEMEGERHLVDQTWSSVVINRLLPAVSETAPALSTSSDIIITNESKIEFTADWFSLLLARMLLSEHDQVRKLSIYRLMTAIIGIENDSNNDQVATVSKRKHRNENRLKPQDISAIFVRLVKPSFIFNVFLPSWDRFASLRSYMIHFAAKKGSSDKMVQAPMEALFDEMIETYICEMENDDTLSEARRKAFWDGVWDTSLVSQLALKTVVRFYRAIHKALLKKRPNDASVFSIPIDDLSLCELYETFDMLFRDRAMLVSIRQELLSFLATVLNHSHTRQFSPINILRLFCVFTRNSFNTESDSWTPRDDATLEMLARWLAKIPIDLQCIGATFAVAFVDGQLNLTFPSGMSIDQSDSGSRSSWDAASGLSMTERELGWGVALFCALSGKDASAAIWPAIHKGISSCDAVIMSDDHPKTDAVARAVLLMENGCLLRQISGQGNGDLLLDPKSSISVPPPPKVERLAQCAVQFVIWQLRRLLSVQLYEEAQSPMRTKVLMSYEDLFETLVVCQRAYPSSTAIAKLMEELLQTGTKGLSFAQQAKATAKVNVDIVLNAALIHASVTAVHFQSQVSPDLDPYIQLCQVLLTTQLHENMYEGIPSEWIQTSRSVIQMSVWGAISCILPFLVQNIETASNNDQAKLVDIIELALLKAVDAVDLNVGLPLFKCILSCSQALSNNAVNGIGKEGRFQEKQLGTVVTSLLRLFSESDKSVESSYILNEMCSFLFSPSLLRMEYHQTQANPDTPAHCHLAFQKLLEMGHNWRPHISNCVLLHIIPAWLDAAPVADGSLGSCQSAAGLNAIPYLDDLVDLLLHKGQRIDEWVAKQSITTNGVDSRNVIPLATPTTSVSRAFGLVYFSKLPDSDLQNEKVVESLNYIITQLLIKAKPKEKHQTLMIGCAEYCIVVRAWQALCVLSRFVTGDVVTKACDVCFWTLREACHTQMRFWVETFCVASAVRYPDIFGLKMVEELSRTDLSVQAACSLMIIAGQFLVGKYPLSYFHPHDEGVRLDRYRQVLAAIVPWLSSPQGFSRAIAQLMVHKLTPMCCHIEHLDTCTTADGFWFVKVMYRFLDENREMKRARNKQQKFFDHSNVEEMCTPEGILSVSVDGAEEATPVHLIDVMKATLQVVYAEAHADDLPSWKRLQNLQLEQLAHDSSDDSKADDGVKPDQSTEALLIQRKIVPLDSLNLALENQREQRLLNAVGTQKHPLIVCATLVTKVPNLGGIARTCEIFAASKLVLGDQSVTKMDNFKSLSVGAAEWLDIEEVNEESLFPWLLQKKQEGYFVVGLEQTSSSVPLHKVQFPPSSQPVILLLGKEKEGIPIQLLSAVDQCFEIPQFGVLRSLNVHVSGAIAIWEYVKQASLTSV